MSYEQNPEYLDAGGFTKRFLEPAQDILEDRLLGIIFEQEYQRVADSPSPEENVAELDGFFQGIQDGTQYHIELRSPHLLKPGYFAWLESRGIGHVYSHWTYLPSIREQWALSNGRFTASNRTVVTRLLTPPRVSYEQAYKATFPFDRPVDEFVNSKWARDMVLDVTALVFQAEQQGYTLDIITNNRAYGNAPELGRVIAHRILDEEERRG